MASRWYLALASFAVGALCLGASPGTAISAGNAHRGKVVDKTTGRPTNADAVAYRMQPRSGFRGDCPIYGDALDRQASDPKDGQFTLTIKQTERIYQATFCRSAYYPRTEPQDNSQSGSAVLPFPTELLARSTSQEDFDKAVYDMLRRFDSDSRYLSESRPDEFGRALQRVSARSEDSRFKQFIEAVQALSKADNLR